MFKPNQNEVHPVEATNNYIDLASEVQNEPETLKEGVDFVVMDLFNVEEDMPKKRLIIPPAMYQKHPDVEAAFAKNKVY